MSTFESLKLTRQFLNAIEEAGYVAPTEIQLKAIPPIMAGQDVIGIAQTGTGKTAAYALPLLQMLKFAQGSEARALILAPGKELVIQIHEVIADLAKYTDLRVAGLYGGIGPKTQLEYLENGVDIIISTPGRFLELYSRGAIPIKKIKHIVLDECDRMMDMGFMPQLRRVQEIIPHKKQNLLFSATFPKRVEQLSDEFLLWPLRIEVTPQATPAVTIDQVVFRVPNFDTKLRLLLHLLKSQDMERVMVFVRTKDEATRLNFELASEHIGTIRFLHSNKGQNARINALQAFRDGHVRILVSTDVTARGMDISDVSHVINFNVPHKHEDYVHRIGRTGRAEKTGTAFTFCDMAEEYHLDRIQKLIRQTIPTAELPKEVVPTQTPYEERQDQMREIDRQKRKENPDFKGAFHQKKGEQRRGKPQSKSPSKTGRKK